MFKRIAIAACAATLLVLLFGTALVLAHAKYASSTPAAESTIASLPSTVNVTFAEELRAVTLNVVGPDGSTVSTDHASIDLAKRTNASVPIRNGGAGRYTVQWTSVSDEDGDSASGSFGFTLLTEVQPAPAAPAPATSAPATTTTTSATSAAATCPATDKPDPGVDPRVNTYCKRQIVRDQYRGKINEATFNGMIADGAKLEDALSEAMEDLQGKEG